VCRRTTCRTCRRPTWAGCGAHVEEVLAAVPRSERCSCPPEDRKPDGLLARLFGRRPAGR